MSGTVTILHLQRFSLHDGPGVRTTVFFKGCNLVCRWCHNPESMNPMPEVQVDPRRCIACGACAEVCPTGAVTLESGVAVHPVRCCHCMKCTEDCVTGAMTAVGEGKRPEEILEEVEKDREMYRISGGGVTFSGGEPLLQLQGLRKCLELCGAVGIHTAVDTAGNLPWAALESVREHVDLFLYDLKCVDGELHRKLTGADNRRILDNLRRLSGMAPVEVRIPFIAGINTGELSAMGDFLAGCGGVRRVELLPYHPLGEEKYRSLGKESPAFAPPTSGWMEQAAELLRKRTGIPVVHGGSMGSR